MLEQGACAVLGLGTIVEGSQLLLWGDARRGVVVQEIGWHALADLVAAKAEGTPPVASRAVSGARLYLVHPFMRWACYPGPHPAACQTAAVALTRLRPARGATCLSVPRGPYAWGPGVKVCDGCREITSWVAAHQTPASRALAAQFPAARGAIVSCWKARVEESLASGSLQQKQAVQQTTASSADSGDASAGTAGVSTAEQVFLAPHQTFDARGRPLFLALRNFHFDQRPIMEALQG